MSATPLTVLYRSFWNFACVFIIVWGYACGLDIIVRLFFVTFSTLWTYAVVFFWPQWIDSGYLVSATPHTILCRSFWNFAHVFSMVWRCAYGLDIILALIFVPYSTLRTLSFPDLRFYESVFTVPCERKSSYNFIPIFLKLCTCFRHSLEMCRCIIL